MVRSENVALICALLVLSSCRVDVPLDARFACQSDADCGGDGLVCAPHPGDHGVCCLPVAETCNGLDDDCDGGIDEELAALSCYSGPEGTQGIGACRAGARPCQSGTFVEACAGEVVPTEELCNGLDDDCDGELDEGFDLTTDRLHCGACGNACSQSQECVGGECIASAESSCSDGVDNDQNAQTDCEDPQCDGRSCGTGCLCEALKATELACDDGADNDGDGRIDCQDEDCAGKLCATPSTFTCDSMRRCSCDGTLPAVPEADGACNDDRDNDCDGFTDCEDSGCDGASCGEGCLCRATRRAEADCGDRADNDGDGLADCADALDCPQGTACTYQQGPHVRTGVCQPNRACK